ncbi:MAG: HAD family hydrolase [Ruminococcus sp.]|nr:HAD family hydrolase [Ruminococcus sp.]MCM1380624.1 HAD family hydrolase [Muribaculaceae bacterium]MCM1478366.1 HAD family hydrolase [Muribaculaceae bacterium]
MPKTLYVTDLDGTLLTSGQYVSEKSREIIKRLTERGMIFSYATARSLITARKVTAGLDFNVPVIVNNGAFIVDNASGEKLVKNTFAHGEAEDIFGTLRHFGIAPLVYSIIDGTEKFSYIPERLTRGMADFLNTRKGDPRHRPLTGERGMLDGEPFYITCIDEAGTMAEANGVLKERYYTVYSRDIYSGDQWLEILPKGATKANAVLQLKGYCGCERLVVFGDGENDIPMFKAADECYAVENAAPALKEIADGIIGGNNEDSVAEYLLINS